MQSSFLICAFMFVVRCRLEVTDRIYLYPWKIMTCECRNTSHYPHLNFCFKALPGIWKCSSKIFDLKWFLHREKQGQNDIFKNQLFKKMDLSEIRLAIFLTFLFLTCMY